MPRPGVLDWRRIRTGKDAELYIGGAFLLHVARWQLQPNFRNEDYQPPGDFVITAVPTGVSFTLTLTETVVDAGDGYLLRDMAEATRNGKPFVIDFRGRVGDDSHNQHVTIRDCVPDGNNDWQSVEVGRILNRALTFRCNDVPDWGSFMV